MPYKVRPGDSPTIIARRLGVPMAALINANPQKPATVVAGVRTFRSIAQNESLNVPAGGFVGDFLGASADQIATATAMAAALSAHGYKQADQPIYMAFQSAMGSAADGFPGSGTMGKLQSVLSSAGIPMPNVTIYPWHASGGYDGVNAPTSAEWYGTGGGAAPASVSTVPSGIVPPTASVTVMALAAVAALGTDPNYCTSVGQSGTAVNTAVHNFKAAWNSANPGNPVPIGTGKYEPVVASALSSALGGQAVPPGCGVATQPAPVQTPAASSGYNAAQIATATAMAAALTVHGYKLADQPLYKAFQSAMGSTADGYPGTGTMNLLRSVLASAGLPMPNVTIYPWKSSGGYDGVNAPTTAQWTGSAAAPPSGGGGGAAPPSGGGQQIVTPPAATKGLSTGAMVAGGLGVVALLGIVAIAASGKKSTTTKSTTTRGPARRKKTTKYKKKKK